MDESQEVPWFTEPPEATLRWSSDKLGHLHFFDPQGNRAAVPVTRGSTYQSESLTVWHIDEDGSTATVSPSIHYVGAWHTPNPVQFKLVDKIQDPKR